MDIEQKPQKMLQMLAENEEAVAKLYRAYAQKFPRYRDFWSDLADEEIAHSRWIQDIYAKTHQQVSVKENKFDIEIFQISLKFLADKVAQARDEEMSVKDALSIALDVETGMLERGSFEVFDAESSELERIMRALTAATEKHIAKVRKELFRKRWGVF